jgi:hypothetical protein
MTATQDAIDRLPELPLETFESIGQLERSDHGPFLTIKPPRVEGRPSAPLPESKKKSSYMPRMRNAPPGTPDEALARL